MRRRGPKGMTRKENHESWKVREDRRGGSRGASVYGAPAHRIRRSFQRRLNLVGKKRCRLQRRGQQDTSCTAFGRIWKKGGGGGGWGGGITVRSSWRFRTGSSVDGIAYDQKRRGVKTRRINGKVRHASNTGVSEAPVQRSGELLPDVSQRICVGAREERRHHFGRVNHPKIGGLGLEKN